MVDGDKLSRRVRATARHAITYCVQGRKEFCTTCKFSLVSGDTLCQSLLVMNATAQQIAIGTSRYNVGIDSSKNWESPDGSVTREYLTIGKPGISEVVNSYIAITPAAPRSSEVSVVTDHGTVVWQPAAGGMTSKKRDAVNAWFVAVLKK